MNVDFDIDPESYRCLLDHVPQQSEAYDAIVKATTLDGYCTTPTTVWITCSEDEARALRAIAERFCPEAVRRIDEGVRLSLASRRQVSNKAAS